MTTLSSRGEPAPDLDGVSAAGVAVLAGASALVGVWALFLPESFFHDFPSHGAGWVALLPPYNEHLVRDVGALTSAIAALLGLAAWRRSRSLASAGVAAWLVANVPHTVFHLVNLGGFPPLAALAQSASQAGLLALAAAVVVRLVRASGRV